MGPWRSWERASMASRRSWVRIPSAPPFSYRCPITYISSEMSRVAAITLAERAPRRDKWTRAARNRLSRDAAVARDPRNGHGFCGRPYRPATRKFPPRISAFTSKCSRWPRTSRSASTADENLTNHLITMIDSGLQVPPQPVLKGEPAISVSAPVMVLMLNTEMSPDPVLTT